MLPPDSVDDGSADGAATFDELREPTSVATVCTASSTPNSAALMHTPNTSTTRLASATTSTIRHLDHPQSDVVHYVVHCLVVGAQLNPNRVHNRPGQKG